MSANRPQHIPVLEQELTELLAVQAGDTVVDCTVGYGGHSCMLLELAGPTGALLGLDMDDSSLSVAASRVEELQCPFSLVRCNFAQLDQALAETGHDAADVILADLGVNSAQLDDPQRGFSFQEDGPLDMRMDRSLPTTAADLVNREKETDLANLIYQYSQERFSRRIARAIVRARRSDRITTTGSLSEIVCRALRVNPASRRQKIHPATRTFQALRIAVNDELGNLERLLEMAPRCLASGGRFALITFHSLEGIL